MLLEEQDIGLKKKDMRLVTIVSGYYVMSSNPALVMN